MTEVIEKRDPVVERVREMLLQRSQVGIRKYGTTLADNPLTHKQWLQHALEESLDLSNYLMSAIMDIEKKEAQAATPTPQEYAQHFGQESLA